MKLPRTTVFTVLVLGTALGLVGCSGGEAPSGGGGGGPASFSSALIGLDTSRSSDGVVALLFRVTGPVGESFRVGPTYQLTSGGALPATPVSDAEATRLGLPTTLPPNLIGSNASATITIPGTEGATVPGQGDIDLVFWWAAGQDLGFLTANNTTIQIPVFDPLTGQPSPGTTGTLTQIIPITLPLLASSGAATGSVAGNPTSGPTQDLGRTGHRSVDLPGNGTDNDVLVTGGYVGSTLPNAYDSADRFAFSGTTHTIANMGLATAIGDRALHRATTYLTLSGALRVLITGGVDRIAVNSLIPSTRSATASVASTGVVFDPSTGVNVPGSQINMVIGRFAHTATWTPFDQIAVIGGATSTTPAVATDAIEHFDVVTGMFFQPVGARLQRARLGHEAVLLQDGRIFVCGGENPAIPGALNCEIYDPATASSTELTATGSSMTRVNHTITRLFNGWILITGGQNPTTRELVTTAVVFRPASGTFAEINLLTARALHAATLLGDGRVYVSGGFAGNRDTSLPGEFRASNAVEVISVDASAPSGFTSTTFSPGLGTARAEHTASSSVNGRVYILGGRDLTTGISPVIDYLESIEILPFSNSLPVIANFTTTFTLAAPANQSAAALATTVTDADGDGGYVSIRWRRTGNPNAAFAPATITAQTPSTMIDPNTGMMTFPNGLVRPGVVTFIWNFTQDGLGRGEQVEVQFLPVGATLGSPLNRTLTLP